MFLCFCFFGSACPCFAVDRSAVKLGIDQIILLRTFDLTAWALGAGRYGIHACSRLKHLIASTECGSAGLM